MGVSTDGILCYGVDLGEKGEVELPWEADEFDGDIEDWFCSLHGISNDALWAEYEIWAQTPEAQAISGYSSERVNAYEAAHPEWREALDHFYAQKRELVTQIPIEEVRHCSGDYPMIIIAVAGTVTKAARGYAEVIDPDAMSAVPYQLALPAAEMFCEEHGIPFENPTWLLASMWW